MSEKFPTKHGDSPAFGRLMESYLRFFALRLRKKHESFVRVNRIVIEWNRS